ncbi:MAG: hypothetical protein FJX45_17955 [Alphaproteobacteria bacterium]|nr:hypothetical protein [Alphaproteobacteria bacterium]
MRKLGVSRRELFEKIERDALNSLPEEFAEWKRARVNLDYHIEIHEHLYSVPHALIRAEVDVRVTLTHDRDIPSRPARRHPSAPLRWAQAWRGP